MWADTATSIVKISFDEFSSQSAPWRGPVNFTKYSHACRDASSPSLTVTRSATAIAVKECQLSFISRTEFEQSTKNHPELYRCLAEALAARL